MLKEVDISPFLWTVMVLVSGCCLILSLQELVAGVRTYSVWLLWFLLIPFFDLLKFLSSGRSSYLFRFVLILTVF